MYVVGERITPSFKSYIMGGYTFIKGDKILYLALVSWKQQSCKPVCFRLNKSWRFPETNIRSSFEIFYLTVQESPGKNHLQVIQPNPHLDAFLKVKISTVLEDTLTLDASKTALTEKQRWGEGL